MEAGELAYGAERVALPELYRRAMRLLADARVLPWTSVPEGLPIDAPAALRSRCKRSDRASRRGDPRGL